MYHVTGSTPIWSKKSPRVSLGKLNEKILAKRFHHEEETWQQGFVRIESLIRFFNAEQG